MYNNLHNLYDRHLDILLEIGNIGAGNAVTALSRLMGRKVDMNVPHASLLEFKDVSGHVGNPEDLVFGVLVNVCGDINGIIMFLVRLDSARVLINSLVGTDIKDYEHFDDMDRSAVQEIGNILISSYVGALSMLTDKRIMPSNPYLALDMAGAILSVPAVEFGKIADSVLFIESTFADDEWGNVSGYFILVPDIPSLDVILKSLGVE